LQWGDEMKRVNFIVIQKFNKLKVRTKIMVLYFTLAILGVGLSTGIYIRMSGNYYETTIHDLNVSEIKNINNSLELLIQDVNNFSKEIIANANIQEVLDPNYTKKYALKQVDQELIGLIEYKSNISSIYIFDFEGNRYYRDKEIIKTLKLEDLMNKSWYQDLVDKHGGYMFNMDGDGLIKDNHYLSFFRIINSNIDHKPIGVMMINISEDVIKETINLNDSEDHMFVIQDTVYNTNMIMDYNVCMPYESYLGEFNDKNLFYKQTNMGSQIFSISGYENLDLGWILIKILPKEDRNQFISAFNLTISTIIILNAILIIYGSFYISIYITSPIIELTESMKQIEQGNFVPVDVHNHYDEIGSLKNGYNFMIVEIQRLIHEIIQEQEAIKQAELKALMEQMKPHFMYNTLDSISALMLLNRGDEAYECLNALSGFYRRSLSDGRLIITVGEELAIIKDYLFIQDIRYKEVFKVNYDIDESLLQQPIPKLILQPLVENSLYHGIRPMGTEGHIIIKVKKINKYVVLEVTDNGLGIPNEKLEYLQRMIKTPNCQVDSIGLPATMKRIRHRYGSKGKFSIKSSKNGTQIQLKLPLDYKVEEVDNGTI
jgi:two-component system sensor histidine kinase YesM